MKWNRRCLLPLVLICLGYLPALAADPLAKEKGPEPPPLTTAQIEKVRELVKGTQARDAELKAALESKQRELAQAYQSFELDESRVSAIEEEIVGLQKQLLANYHSLQVELRKTVGPERFVILIQRINSVLKNPVERPKSEAAKRPE